MTELMPRILAIDDDKIWLEQLPLIFEDYQVDGVPSIDQGLQAIETSFYDVILLDLNFNGDNRTGLDVFRRIHAADSGADVIVLSGESNKDKIIDIFNAGVTQYISKPASNNVIRTAVEKVLELRKVKRRALEQISNYPSGTPLVGCSLAIQKVRELTRTLIAGGAKDILLQGESGTGKEVLAKYIAHATDPSCRLVSINCAGLNEGLIESHLFGHVKGGFTGADKERQSPFEVAAGGFVFLDEIGDMPLLQQPKLLRVLQERKVQRVGSNDEVPVNFKVIAATNVNIDEAVMRGRFREDLLYRIAKHRINIPALRERIEDIPDLVHYFLSLSPVNRKKQITQDALNLLQSYSWPGNVRELKTIVENAEIRAVDGVIRDKEICQALPEVAKLRPANLVSLAAGRYGTTLIVTERRRFEKALLQSNNDRVEAAKILGISRATFFRKAKDLGLVKERKSKGVNL